MTHDRDTGGIAALRNLRAHKVAEGDPDVRGWEVAGGDNLRIGTVNDLLVDTVAGKVRYLDIELDPGLYLQGEPATGPAAESEPNPGASTMTEYLVRESISDTENQMTAHLHLDDRHHPGERHVVFPVGQARLDPEHDRVILASQRAEDALNLPAYIPGEVSPDYEQSLRRWFDPSFAPAEGEDLYAHDLYDEDSFYRNRRETPVRGR
jgi:hypothetical protein